jgi:DnaJ like chaperone protein
VGVYSNHGDGRNKLDLNWWGKIIGGLIGFVLGGPIGALFGAFIGHSFDKGAEQFGFGGDPGRAREAFFDASFRVMGHLAKADGQVSPAEVRTAESIMANMRLTREQRRQAIARFQEGKRLDFQLDPEMVRLRNACGARSPLYWTFLEILVAAAFADGYVSANERQILNRVCYGLKISTGNVDRLIMMHQAAAGFGGAGFSGAGVGAGSGAGQQRRAPPSTVSGDPYAVLGVKRSASNAEIKRAYRKLMSQHHPDKLLSRGLPEEMMQVAQQKTRDINAAYDRIQEERGIK